MSSAVELRGCARAFERGRRGYDRHRPAYPDIGSPAIDEHPADALNALLGTMSFWARLSARQRDAVLAENRALHQRLGRPSRSSIVACLVTAQRKPHTSR